MNEVALHRGSSPHLNTIDAFVDGQHLTEAVVSTTIRRPKAYQPYTILFPVGWFDCFYSNRLYGLFPFCGWPDRSSFAQRSGSYPNLSPKSIFPATGIPSLFLHHISSACYTDAMPLHMAAAFHPDDYLQIGERSRAPAGVSMDGQASHILSPGESVTVRSSLHPIPCINRSSISDPALDAQGEGAGPGKEDDWVRDINNLLQYNATFRSKALLRHSRS